MKSAVRKALKGALRQAHPAPNVVEIPHLARKYVQVQSLMSTNKLKEEEEAAAS